MGEEGGHRATREREEVRKKKKLEESDHFYHQNALFTDADKVLVTPTLFLIFRGNINRDKKN